MPDKIFNENSLREAIVGVWGEYGAHVEVYDMLLKELKRLQTPPPDAAVREAVEHLKWHLTGRYMGRHHERHMEVLLRAVQAPRLTPEQEREIKAALNWLDFVGDGDDEGKTIQHIGMGAKALASRIRTSFAWEVDRG